MIISPNGTIVHKLNANDLLEDSHKESETFLDKILPINYERIVDPISYVYYNFLNDVVKRIDLEAKNN